MRSLVQIHGQQYGDTRVMSIVKDIIESAIFDQSKASGATPPAFLFQRLGPSPGAALRKLKRDVAMNSESLRGGAGGAKILSSMVTSMSSKCDSPSASAYPRMYFMASSSRCDARADVVALHLTIEFSSGGENYHQTL